MNMTKSRIKSRTRLQLTAAVLLALVTAATNTHAQTWTKTGNPGNLPGNAQITVGTGPLEEITGTFTFMTTGTERTVGNGSNPDLFAIRIDGTSPFSATTLGQVSDVFDTQLFLFDASGYGVYANDDAFPDDGFIKSQAALIAPDVSPAPGLYYLGISTGGIVARSGSTAATDIFDNTVDDTSGATPFTGLRTPRPGAGPLTKWFLSGSGVETGSYSIALTGATYAVPEASTWVSFGVPALLVLAVMIRRRVKPVTASV